MGATTPLRRFAAGVLLAVVTACGHSGHATASAGAPSSQGAGQPRLIFPSIENLAKTDPYPNGNIGIPSIRPGSRYVIGSLLLCSLGGSVRILAVRPTDSSNLVVTGFGTKPNPLLTGGRLLLEHDGPLAASGFLGAAVTPCRPNYQQISFNLDRATTELGIEVSVATRGSATASGFAVVYQAHGGPSRVVTAVLPVCVQLSQCPGGF